METTMETVWTIILGVVANIVTLALIGIVSKIPSSLSRHDPRKSSRLLPLLIAFLPVINFIFFFFVIGTQQSIWWLMSIPISLSILLWILWQQLDRLWGVGIRGVDKHISKGISYKESLDLVQNSLKFLGIGASKLSRTFEFEAALVRCKREEPIKLLLCNPEDERLLSAAKRFNKPEHEYKDNTIASLRKIVEIKNKRALNIEVRFYSKDCNPVFRLMFIDNSICLYSYNVWGEGDGSQCPQLHVVNPPSPTRTVTSFYYPLEVYFDSLWERCTSWDFKQYL
jgi:hypothetical protein